MKHYKQYINGQFVDSKATSVIEVLNPCTEEVISTISSGTVEDANNALEAATSGTTSLGSITWQYREQVFYIKWLMLLEKIEYF